MTKSASLLLLTPALGMVSETFIARHCEELAPQNTVFGAFSVERESAAWPVERTQILSPSPAPWPSVAARIQDRFRQTTNRYAHRDAWWVADDAVHQIAAVCRDWKPRVALLEFLDRWLNVIPLLVDAGIRTVVHGHGYDFSSSIRNPATVRGYQQYLNLADAVLVPSEFAADRLSALGISNVSVVPYGVEIPAPQAPTRPRNDVTRLVAVGRLTGKKDPVGLVEAVAVAIRRGTDVALDMYGGGPLESVVRRRIQALGVGRSIRLHGARPHAVVLDAMALSDVFVQRSITPLGGDEEGLPVAILEAMARGLPIVSTNHAGIPEAVLHDSTGLLSDEDDTQGFAAHIVSYASDPRLRVRHGQMGRERAIRHYNWQHNKARLTEILGL